MDSSSFNYNNCSKEELIAQIIQLKQENLRLKNVTSNNAITNKQKPFNFENCKFRHVLLKFLYLGWDYRGYVTQENIEKTIEHEIFKALIKTCLIRDRSSSNYHRCGRTDKGVSSFSQVISLDVRSKSDNVEEELDYCNILNRVLPDDIHFVAWYPVDDNFSARFDCKHRTYKYFFPKDRLDIEAMKKAGDYLLGTHDFRNFCKMDVSNGVVEYVRTIRNIVIDKFHQDETRDSFSMYVLTINGNAFLWHQIRCIVGVLILIGQGKENPEIIPELLDINNNPRKPDYQMASEIPLNLYDCFYQNVDWICNKTVLNIVSQKLSNFWTILSIKSAMIKSMVLDLQKNANLGDVNTADFLIPGIKRKNYVPLMKRQLCDSLEEKIQKRQKRTEKEK